MLTRLYSDTGLLVKDVKFEPGINVIYGKYSGSKQAKGINGIGKSSLVRLINFMLLSDSSEKEFSKEKYEFLRNESHTLTLEFQMDARKFRIRRSFESTDDIYFETVGLSLGSYSRADLLPILTNIFFPVENNQTYIEGNRFRSIIQFYIKDDIQNRARKEPTNFSDYTPSAAERLALNFFLLGLPTKNLFNYNEILKEYRKYAASLKTFEEKLQNENGLTVKEYRSEKLRINIEIENLRKRLTDYNFEDSHKDIEGKLKIVVSQINEASLDYHSFSQKLENIRDSYQVNSDIDTQQIEKIYNEVLTTFGSQVKKSLDEIKAFKSELLQNRNKFLVTREKEISDRLQASFEKLTELEKQRTKLLASLKEEGILDKVEDTYEQLITQQGLYERQNQILQQVDEYDRILSDQELTLGQIKGEIVQEISTSIEDLNALRSLFIEILVSAILMDQNDNSGYFDLPKIRTSNVTNLPYKIEVNIPKSSSKGQEALKIIAYDLMIFLNQIIQRRKLPDFLIHDGVFHGMSHKTMINILNYVYKKHLDLQLTNQFQYIVTFSEDEVEIPQDKSELYGEFNFDFDSKKIIVLEDVAEKMLFKKDIK